MKKNVIFLLILSFVYSDAVNLDDVRNWDQMGQYNRICNENVRDLFIKEQNDSVANMYAKACLKLDKLNELIIPMVMLYKDKESRENSALYSTVLFQKKMLYLSLVDNMDISYIRTPKINYILSEIFDKYVVKDYIKNNDKYIFNTDNGQKAELFVKEDSGIKKMVVLLYKNDKIDSIKMYW